MVTYAQTNSDIDGIKYRPQQKSGRQRDRESVTTRTNSDIGVIIISLSLYTTMRHRSVSETDGDAVSSIRTASDICVINDHFHNNFRSHKRESGIIRTNSDMDIGVMSMACLTFS